MQCNQEPRMIAYLENPFGEHVLSNAFVVEHLTPLRIAALCHNRCLTTGTLAELVIT